MFEKVKFDKLAEELMRDYRINNKKSTVRAERSVKKLSKFFDGVRVVDITSPKISKYVEMRQREGAENATINRELSALKRMLNLGAQQTPPIVDRVPKIKMLRENNTRKGFFEHDEFLAIREALPEYLKGFVTFAYKLGWRAAEIANLSWPQVDRGAWTVRLEVGTTKNNEGRIVFLDDELQGIFKKQWAERIQKGCLLPYVFPGCHNKGKIKDFRGPGIKHSK